MTMTIIVITTVCYLIRAFTASAILKRKIFYLLLDSRKREFDAARFFFFGKFIFLGSNINCLQHSTQAAVQYSLKKHFDAHHFPSPANDKSSGIQKKYLFFLPVFFVQFR